MRSNSGSDSAAPSWMIDIDAIASATPEARPLTGSVSVRAASTRDRLTDVPRRRQIHFGTRGVQRAVASGRPGAATLPSCARR